MDYKFLRFTDFKSIFQWDLKRYLNKSFKSKYSIVALETNIEEESNKYAISEPGKQYGILGVNNQTGIFDAYLEDGAKIKQKYKKMKTGWIAYNPYRVNVGSIGIKKEEHRYEYISPAYVVFSCKSSLLPDYLFLTMKTPTFNKIIKDNTTGSVRQNLSFDTLKELTVPMPSLSEQEALIKAYKEKMQQAWELEERASQIEKEIEKYLLSELNVSITKAKLHKGLNLIRFKDVERWDIPFFFSSTRASSKYDTVKLATCLDKFMISNKGQSLRTETYKNPTNTYHYIGMDNVEKNTGTLIDLPKVNGSDIKSQTVSVPIGFFIYGKLRPYLNKYWINDTNETDIVCSSEFFVFSIKERINKLFFKYLLSSTLIQSQISDAVSGARMPRINESVFKSLLLPIPPRSIQDEIAEHINKKKGQIKQMKQQAEELRKKALEEFEKEIFIC